MLAGFLSLLGLVGVFGLVCWTFEPLIIRPPALGQAHTSRMRYPVSDWFWLTALLQIPLGAFAWMRSRLGGGASWAAVFAGALLLFFTVASWRMSLAVLQRHGVKTSARRGLLIVVAMPLAIAAALTAGFAWPALIYDTASGVWRPGLLATFVATTFVAFLCRAIFNWILKKPQRSPAIAHPCSPFDAGSPRDAQYRRDP